MTRYHDFTIFWVVQKVMPLSVGPESPLDPILLNRSHDSAISVSRLTGDFTRWGCILQDFKYLTVYLARRDGRMPSCTAGCHHDSDTGRPTIPPWAPPLGADRSTGDLCSGSEETQLK